jgi:hypothetical protein
LEVRGVSVGIVLCILGAALFLYGLVSMNYAMANFSSFLVVIGIFLGMTGLLVLAMNFFSSGSLFS